MDRSALANLLKVKIGTIEMMAMSGYNVDEDRPVLDYKPKDLEGYFKYAKNNSEDNAVRRALTDDLKGGTVMNQRSSLSVIYPSKKEKNRYALVFFVPIQKSLANKSVSNQIIQIAINICLKYVWKPQIYCGDCTGKLDDIKKCFKCPSQQYCGNCFDDLKCQKCEGNTFCNTCKKKMRKFDNYIISLEKCGNCTDEEFCEKCDNLRKEVECKDCDSFKIRNGDKSNTLDETKQCFTCLDNLKCPDCDDNFCDDCEKKFGVSRCDKCPVRVFCKGCQNDGEMKDFKPCKKCGPVPEIIERCVIVSELPLSSEAKQLVSTPHPKIKASTGEDLEVGCLTQVFMDYSFYINPLKYSSNCRFQVMSKAETIDFFTSKRNNVKESQIHQIDMLDPVCKYLGLIPGNFIRIERLQVVPGSISSIEVIYRHVRRIPKDKKNKRNMKKKIGTIASGTNIDAI